MAPPNSPKSVRSQKRKLPPPVQLVSPVDQPLYYIPTGPEATEPKKLFPHDAGFDLYTSENVTIDPQDIAVVSTGLYLIIPPGYTGFVEPKSGVTMDLSILVLTGTIDSSYRGIVQIMLFNLNKKTKVHIPQKSCIAQLFVCKLHSATNFFFTDHFSPTERGNRGFGNKN